MKNRLLLFLQVCLLSFVVQALFFSSQATAQKVPEPQWSYTLSRSEIKTGEETELVFTAVIPQDWYVYSNDFNPDLGPIIATFNFQKNATYELVGKVMPKGAKKKFDEVWGSDVSIFTKKLEFRQKIKVLAANPVIKGDVEYQMCSEVTGQCVLFYPEFSFTGLKVAAGGASLPPSNTQTTAPEEAVTTPVIPDTASAITPDTATSVQQAAVADDGQCHTKEFKDDAGHVSKKEEDNLFMFAFVAFLAGLVALLTPCVFPMIPMTVTFFLKTSHTKAKAISNGLIYGVSIVAIYTLIGTIFSVVFGATGANEFATNAVVNIVFFLVFVIFAAAFFGMFEITLPSRFINKMDKQADRGGLIGVFFMAFTLVLVSFSCTGPIVGSILVEASQGAVIRPIVGMIGFALAFALPFTLFAIFPQWLNSLPKSGGWLNSVKVVLGFIELALGLKFLSVADQVYHWGLLDREVYIGIWIVIFTLCGLYLIGKLKFAHDSDLKFVSVPRLMFSIASFSFVIYLFPGMFGASLPALAGYLPPTTSHGFNLPEMIRGNQTGNICEKPKYNDFLHLPHGIKGYFEYNQALACARTLKKPLFIDFTGHGCVNCRKMEDKVWANPEVLRRLNEDFVVVALYVDDRTEADSAQWRLSRHDGKLKKTIGRINADIQICDFGHNAQPYYVLLDNNADLLAEPRGSNYNVKEFISFLDEAKARFDKRMKNNTN